MTTTERMPNVEEGLGRELGIEASDFSQGSWFFKVVERYLQWRYGQGTSRAFVPSDSTTPEVVRAQTIIRRACIKSAITGATAGALSTGATVLTAQTEGLAALIAVPVAALGIGSDMVYRAFLHIKMTCDLADTFGVRLDPDDPLDLWHLFALAFKVQGRDENSHDPGKQLLVRVMHLPGEEVGESIGSKLLGESVVRNVIPFVGVASSSVANWKLTRRVGDTARRYMRYRRALRDALAKAQESCGAHIDLLVEGVWFLFIADGHLSPEETAVLTHLLRLCTPIVRTRLMARFVEDETDWLERLPTLPQEMRDSFFSALEVAAAVDKHVSVPERTILRRVAHSLGRTFNPKHIYQMIQEFEEVGILTEPVS